MGESSKRSRHRDEEHEERRERRSSKHLSSRSERREERDERRAERREKHSSSRSSRHEHDRKRRRHDEEEEEDEWVEAPPSVVAATAPSRTDPAARAEDGKSDVLTAPVDPAPATFSVARGHQQRQGGLRLEPMDTSNAYTDGFGAGDVGDGDKAPEEGWFESMGTERKRKDPNEIKKPDPAATMGQSSRELNKSYWQPDNATAATKPADDGGSKPAPGSSGSSWRMAKLRRVYEAAEDERRPVEEVALERYGSLEAFEAAIEERRVLDKRPVAAPRASFDRRDSTGGRKFVFTDAAGSAAEGGFQSSGSRPGSRQSFRKPGEPLPSTTGLDGPGTPGSHSGSRPGTPVPRVFAPTALARANSATNTPSAGSRAATPAEPQIVVRDDPSSTGVATAGGAIESAGQPRDVAPVLSQSELNKLQSRALKARMRDAVDADALEAQFERERQRSEQASTSAAFDRPGEAAAASTGKAVEMLPTVDARGRIYDTAARGGVEDPGRRASGRKKKEKYFESRDKDGNLVAVNADDEQLSLADLVREERFSGGGGRGGDPNREFADRIARDNRFENDEDYVDDHSEALARRKLKTDSVKRAYAIADYSRIKKALDSCTLCFSDEGAPPKAPVVALGTRAYLTLPQNEPLVPYHCRITTIAHTLSFLEADEDTWDEVSNFMKTLRKMCAEERDEGVVFVETIVEENNVKHTCIDAIPVPWPIFDVLPGYFAEAIRTSEQEWSQHQKLITFSAQRPFRRSLVSNLPYFAVMFDHKGEQGYGHVIEGIDDAPERDEDGYEQAGQLGEKGGGEYTRYFAQEIIGNLLSLEPRAWRRPKRIPFSENTARVSAFRKLYASYDWTGALRPS